MYKYDLVLNNPHWLICHKHKKPNQIKPCDLAPEFVKPVKKTSWICRFGKWLTIRVI